MNQIETAISLSEQVKSRWNELQKSSSTGTQEAERRKQAFDQFRLQGFPGTKNEDWKYTDVHKILDIPYAWPVRTEQELSEQAFEALPFTHPEDAYRMVFINGHYAASLSGLPSAVQGCAVRSMREASRERAFVDHFGQVAPAASGFVSLNTALHTDGAFISLEPGMSLDKPLFLYYVAQGEQEAYFVQPRNLIVLGDKAQARIIEVFVSAGEEPTFTNIVTEITVGAAAQLDYTKLQTESHQNYHIGTTQIRQGRDAKVDTHILSLDGAFIRNNLNFQMTDKNSTAILNGLYLLHNDQFLDNHTEVDHAVPGCLSDQLYKGIIDDKATGVFNGKILVRQDAQKTNAYQRNVNILLSDDASVNTKPQLEIFADDVRCTHGATTGYLNDEAVFYLRSRGIGEREARLLLMNAFAGEIIDKLNVESLKQPLMDMIAEKLRNQSSSDAVRS